MEDSSLFAARRVIGALGGLFVVLMLVWFGYWVSGEIKESAPREEPRPPPPPPPTEKQRNTCWLDQSKPGCEKIMAQTGRPKDPICPLGGNDQGNWSDGRRCAIDGQACPTGATCGNMFSAGANQTYYLGIYQPEAPPPPEPPVSEVRGANSVSTISHTDDGVPYAIPAMYPVNAVSSTGELCVKDPKQPGCPPTDAKALCCSRAPPGECVQGCPSSSPCVGEKIPYAVFHHESCGGSELVHTVNVGHFDTFDYGI